MNKNKKSKKWSESKALKAFKDFYITKIAIYDNDISIVDEGFRKRWGNPIDIEITLENSKNKAKFVYSSPMLQYLDEYSRELYLFMINRPRGSCWVECRKVYNGNDFVERDIKYHENEKRQTN